ncbi:MAG TPA: TraB/GumN family protein [Geminicoccaceae bacterium]|nr:TraB/GumN family protein [Geminicoccaceae bacterium]
MIAARSIRPMRDWGAWLLCVTLLAGCAAGPSPSGCSLPEVEAAARIPFGQGVLWRIEPPDAPPSYLLGTLHSRDPEIVRLPEPVAARLDQAQSLSVEVLQTPRAMQVYRRMIELEDGDLEDLIGPARMAAVERAGARYGVSEPRLRELKPWVLSVLFSVPPADMTEGRPMLDRVLEERAAERGIPVYGLERIEEQIGAYDRLDLEQQIALLDAALAQNPQIECWWEQVIKPAYLGRDAGTLYALMPKTIDGDATLWRALIVERNARMVERMRPRLREGNAFIAVGAAHLPGEDGILSLLSRQGYDVVPIY